MFASKYSLESSWRDLQDLHLCDLHIFAPFRSQNFSQKSSTFVREWIIEFPIFSIFCVEFVFFSPIFQLLMKFCPDFATNSRKEWRESRFQSNLRKQIRKLPKFWNLWKLFIIIHHYSFVSLIKPPGSCATSSRIVLRRRDGVTCDLRLAYVVDAGRSFPPAYVGSPTQLSNYLTLKGSFSAVSKPNFASKYALDSSRRDLQNALLCTVCAPFSKLNVLFENRWKCCQCFAKVC